MALDGIVVASLAKELQENFTNARLSKIAQPEKDELLLTMKGSNGQKRLLLSASASLPLVYISDKNKPSPMSPDRTEFLHAASKTCGKWTDHCDHATGNGTNHCV